MNHTLLLKNMFWIFLNLTLIRGISLHIINMSDLTLNAYIAFIASLFLYFAHPRWKHTFSEMYLKMTPFLMIIISMSSNSTLLRKQYSVKTFCKVLLLKNFILREVIFHEVSLLAIFQLFKICLPSDTNLLKNTRSSFEKSDQDLKVFWVVVFHILNFSNNVCFTFVLYR